MRVFLFAVVGSVVSLAGVARADQCAGVDADAASWAQKVVTRGAMVSQFCETCGDKAPAAAQKVTSIATVREHGNTHVTINGKPVDLAYTYVQTGKTTWSNVGMLVGCGAQGTTAIVTSGSSAPAEAPMTTTELGPEFGACAEYVHAINQLGRCDKFPKESARAMHDAIDAMRDSFKQWKTMPADAKKAMLDACKQAKDAIAQASSAMGCKL